MLFRSLNLGFLYGQGRGVSQDYAEAVRWFRAAAEQGDATAQYNLGVLYHEGRGVPQDFVRAHMWLNLAASTLTGSERDDYAEARDAVAARMTSAQIAEAQRLAREWTPSNKQEPR